MVMLVFVLLLMVVVVMYDVYMLKNKICSIFVLKVIWFAFHVHENRFLVLPLLKPFFFSWLSENRSFWYSCSMFCFCSSPEAPVSIPLLLRNSPFKSWESKNYNMIWTLLFSLIKSNSANPLVAKKSGKENVFRYNESSNIRNMLLNFVKGQKYIKKEL